jgi:hypothetical protein
VSLGQKLKLSRSREFHRVYEEELTEACEALKPLERSAVELKLVKAGP